MANESKRRILRIGVIQSGKIVEERLLRKEEDITVGQGARNTFIVPDAKLPKSFTLFERKGAGYQLVFNSKMQGRVSIGEDIYDLKSLAKSGKTSRQGGNHLMALDDSSRGKVVVGDVTFLFQFVDAPKVVPKPQLPAAARGMSNRIDWTFTYIIVLCALLLGGGGVGADIWWRLTGQYLEEQYADRRARAYEVLKAEVLQQKEEEEQQEDKTEESDEPVDEAPEPAPEPQPEKKPTKKPAKKSVDAGKRESRTKKQVAASVRKKTFLHVLGSDDGEGGSLANTLKDGVANSKLDEAFKLNTGVDFAKAGQEKMYVGEPTVKNTGTRYKTLSGKEGGRRIATKSVKTEDKEKRKEKKVSIRVRGGSLTGQSGTGKIDKSSVARVFRRRKGAIKYCYEKALKTNPNLKGKVSIRFKIGTAGRITTINVTSNTTGSSSVGSCITSKVQSWRFPPAEGGSVTFTHTFILEAS